MSAHNSDTQRTDAKERESEKCEPQLHAHYGWKFARTLERELSAAAERERGLRTVLELIGDEIPTTWLDPLLTGPNAVIGQPKDGKQIEALLLALKKRIEAFANAALERKP